MTIDQLLQPILKTKEPLRTDDTPQTRPEWDSFAHVNIIATLEDTLGVELNTTEVVSLTSVADVIAICKAHGLNLN